MAPLLSACLIVRDEEARLSACLAALDGLVDEVVVLDTGSVDGTVALARSAGAVVAHRAWDGDFAAARNAALAYATGEWVLSVDADEVVSADAPALRAALRAGSVPAGALVRVLHRADAEGHHEVLAVKLFRREGARWSGAVHERVRLPAGSATGPCPVPVLFDHSGYTGGGAARKAERNLALALDALAREPDEGERWRLRLETGRALIGLGRHAEAVEVLRHAAAAPGPTGHAAATHLVRALLAADEAEAAVQAVAELRRRTRPDGLPLVDLLDGEAHLHVGDAGTAALLLAPIAAGPPPVDVEGRTPPAGAAAVALGLALALLGRPSEAAEALLTAVRQGADVRVELPLLRSCWAQAGRTDSALGRALPVDSLRVLAEAGRGDVDVATVASPLLVAAGHPGPLTRRCDDEGLGIAARLQAGLLAELADEPGSPDRFARTLVPLAAALDPALVPVLAGDLAARHAGGAAALQRALEAAVGVHPSGRLKTRSPVR